MPSLKALRKRIATVRSTQQITKAMKMVAAAKLRRAQEAAERARPYAATNGYLDGLPVDAIQRYERELHAFLEAKHGAVLTLLREKKELTDDVRAKVDAALADFGKLFKA